MQSVLIVHSKHTRVCARTMAKKYKDVTFFEVTSPPTEAILKFWHNKELVIGVGGGSVIDTAKIISGKRRCVAIPTTASGAAMTPFATIWGKRKQTVITQEPLLKAGRGLKINLPKKVVQSTLFDVLSHSIESYWSKKATPQSKSFARKAIRLVKRYFATRNIRTLIQAGNMAGRAIATTKTNVVHATAYPLTIRYGIEHGLACGSVLPYFVEFMDYRGLPSLFNLNSTEALMCFLRKMFKPQKIKDFDPKYVAREAMKYRKIQDGPRKISCKQLEKILEQISNI